MEPLDGARRINQALGVIIGVLAMLPGIYFLLRGFGMIRSRLHPLGWTDHWEILVGATLCGAGAGFAVAALDLSRRARRATGHAIWACLAMVYTWTVTIIGFDQLAYTSMGPMTGIQFWRALVVAFDLYVALSILDNVLEELRRAPAKRNKLAYAAGCIALAFTLELSGGVAKVYAKLGLRMPGPAATIGLLRSNSLAAHFAVPELPLEDFAGTWFGARKGLPGFPGWGAGWISRVDVSIASLEEARVHLWRS